MTQQMGRTSGCGIVKFDGDVSEIFGIGGMAGGGLTGLSNYDGGTVLFIAGHDPDELRRVDAQDGTAITTAIGALKSVPIPREVFLFPFFKIAFATPPTDGCLGISLKS